MPHETAIAGQAWTPPASLAAWWYADSDVAAGQNWIDQIAGYTLPVATGCNVTAGTGLIVPATKAAAMASNYTPAGGGPMVGSTLCLWMRLIAPGSSTTGYAMSTTGIAGGCIRVGGTGFRAFIANAYGGSNSSGGDVEDGVWLHLALTQFWGDDASQTNKAAAKYRNSAPISVPLVGAATATAPLRLIQTVTSELAIDLDDVQWYTRALSAAEIAYIYANSPGRH